MKISIVTIAMLLLVLLSSTSEAQLPHTLSYQGVLTDSSGIPKPNGSYSFTFRLYDVSTGGVELWNEVKQLEVKSGLFSTLLGDQDPFTGLADFSKPYWLGIQAESEPELSPRIPLSAVAYSFQSLKADSARNALYADSSTFAKTTQIPNGMVVRNINGLHDDIVLIGAGGATVTSHDDSLIVSTSGGGEGSGIQGVQNTNNTLDISNPNGPTATINLKMPLSLTSAIDSGDVIAGTNNGVWGTGVAGRGTVNGVYGYSEVNGVYGGSSLGTGVFGFTNAANVSAVFGRNNGDGWGIFGYTPVGFAGVFGSGAKNGVYGQTNSTNDAGVYGRNDGDGSGVSGYSVSGLAGVYGSGSQNGVYGTTSNPSNAGVYGNHDANGMGVFGISVSGDGIVGKSSGAAKSGIWGDNTGGGYGVAGSSTGGTTAGVWGTNSSTGIGVKGNSTSGDGIYGFSQNGFNGIYGESQRSNGTGIHGVANGGTSAWGVFGESTTGIGVRGISNDGTGMYGIGIGNGYAVHGYMTGTGRAGLFEVNNSSNNLSGLFATHNGTGNCFAAVHSGTGRAGYFEINNPSSNTAALYVTTNGTGLAADFNGNVAVKELQINGGSDMAEPFKTTTQESIEPGTVIVLDPLKEGTVKVSSLSYDKKVVGIVSGAGGVKPGLTLRQEETLNGDVLLAIAGRVYCKAEAMTVPIEPGDLLTTSALPGHAMKAVDSGRSHGTIIGKALSRLDEGTGLVLVLVNLQ